jgi:GH25 family lysozyme M1 (1,4-beta-N-acetylmuramidase)
MIIYGWDLSHHDWGRGPVDIGAAVADGISFMTHKIGEGTTFADDRFDDFWQRARAARVPLIGAYYVNHPGDQITQADRFLTLLDARAPSWRGGPFVLQVDAEKFDYMDRAPTLSEIQAFCGRLVARTNAQFRPVVYAPKWVYGDKLRGLGYPLWASAYGANPTTHYRTAYPGDNSTRWAAYSGQTPAILQYGSRTRIGSQNTCDANAFRGTLTQLRALVHPLSKENDMAIIDDLLAADLVPNDINPGVPGQPGYNKNMQVVWALRYATHGYLAAQEARAARQEIKAATAKLDAILAAQQGVDTQAILARIDEHAQAEAARDAQRADAQTVAEQTAALVLAGLTAPQIAAALLAAWPAAQARQTAAEVVEQLGVLLSARTTEGREGA